MTRPGLRSRLPGRSVSSDPIRTPENVLIDTVAHLQMEVEAMNCGPPGHQTLDRPTSPIRMKPVVFTYTMMPKFAGVTTWEQHRQVFDAIAQSNGWGDATAALQLMSHLEGDALNVALLVPDVRLATRTGLVGVLTEQYGSPGWLADYRRQFEKTARKEGEDPSIFAMALETLGRQSLLHKATICSIVKSRVLIAMGKVTCPKYDVTKGNVIKSLICRSCDVEITTSMVNKEQLSAQFYNNSL